MAGLHGAPGHYVVGTCPSCKRLMFASRRDARRAAKGLYPGRHLRPYQCGRLWHFGSLAVAKAVR